MNDIDRDAATAAHQAVLDAEAALESAIRRRNQLLRELRQSNPQRGYVSALGKATGLHRTVVQRILRGPVAR